MLLLGDPGLGELLGSGWPGAGLVEVGGRGRSSLALLLVRACQSRGAASGGGGARTDPPPPTVWIDGPGRFCPATARIDLEALTLVRPGAREASRAGAGTRAMPSEELGVAAGRGLTRSPLAAALFAADVLLRSRAFALVVLDLPRGRGAPSHWFRLARLATRARSLLLLLHEPRRPVAGSAADMVLAARLAPTPGPPWADLPAPRLELRLLRHRGAPERQGRGVSLLLP